MRKRALPTLVADYVRWTLLRAVLHRGWWLVTSLYLVVEANLSPLQLVMLGTFQGLTVVLCEIPTGLVADNFSRKWSIVIAHLLMGTGMLATGLVTSFPALLLTQMLWGLSWAFSTGADVAWLTDELEQPKEIGQYLGIAARWGQVGAAIGLVLIGGLAWLTSLAFAIVLAGSLMLILGGYVAVRFPERHFARNTLPLASKLQNTLASGIWFVRNDRSILLILCVTFLVNGADEVFSRLFAKGLLDLGLPQFTEPVVWLTLLGLVTLGVGVVVLRVVQHKLQGQVSLRRLYLIASLLGALGILLFALAPSPPVAMAGVIVVHGIAWNLVRVVGVIWMNARAAGHVRATLQSFLSQAENLGEVVLGFGLGVLAESLGISSAMLVAACVVVVAAMLIRRHTLSE